MGIREIVEVINFTYLSDLDLGYGGSKKSY